MDIVPRSGWDARPPRSRFLIPTPTPKLYLHHTASPTGGPARVRAIQNYHMDVKKWSDIAYSYLVSAAGIIYEGRGAGVAGGHTAGQNTVSHAICAMGNYDNDTPSQVMFDSIRQLLAHGHQEGWWPATFTGGHRDAPGADTSCPGDKLYALIPALNHPIPPEDDMPLTADDIKKIWEYPVPDEDDGLGTRGAVHALRQAWGFSRQASIDAATARALAEQAAARGGSLSQAEIDAIGQEIADAFVEKLTD